MTLNAETIEDRSMDPSAIQAAASALADARRSGHLVAALPASARPQTVADAHAIQDASVTALGETVSGWKVNVADDGEAMRGVILGSRMLASPAHLRTADVPMLGIEVEIAFRFERDMPPRERPYEANEIAEAVTALVGIEVVDSRFASYADTPVIDRLADCMSNGAFVAGTARPDWREFDLATLKATLSVNGRTVVEKTGGHAAGDPIRPAIALVNALRLTEGVAKDRIMTTGTYTGLHTAQPGDHIVASFEDFGSAELHLDRDAPSR
jgi:2-keto-4-pentenoate hydratase